MASPEARASVAPARRAVVWTFMGWLQSGGRWTQAVACWDAVVRYQSRVVVRAVAERGGQDPEGGPELAVVHDPRLGELVERVEVLTQLRA